MKNYSILPYFFSLQDGREAFSPSPTPPTTPPPTPPTISKL
jgi:hypothetical protein